MADRVEEEEMRVGRGLDQHADIRSYDCQEADHIHDTNAIQDDIAWTSQGLG